MSHDFDLCFSLQKIEHHLIKLLRFLSESLLKKNMINTKQQYTDVLSTLAWRQNIDQRKECY